LKIGPHLPKLVSNTKRRAASLRQQSFVFSKKQC